MVHATGLMKHGSLPGYWGLNRRTRRCGVRRVTA
ncbi:IS2 ORF2 [Escherichia coli H591]|nr:IS2 ORF2 [Escherichia coli H591]